MESKKINQLATEMAPASTDLTIIGDPITGVSKKVTLLQIADLFSTIGTVTSVGVTETGDALTITGSPITSAGTINIGFAGDATQYVRGDGALADFPTSTGGGSSVSYYLNSSVSQGTIGGVAYREFSKDPISGAGTDITASTNGYIASYLTDANDPALLEVPAGNFNCELYFSVNSNAHNPYVYAELYKYDGTTFTLLGSSQSVPEYLSNGTTLSPYYFAIPVTASVLTITDRLAIRIYANVDTRVVTLHTENSHLCQVVTTFSKGLTTLNNLTRQIQFLATGTSGTDFAISSSTATHTFNLPTASAANRGALSSADWTTFNNKASTADLANYLLLTGGTLSGLLNISTASYLTSRLKLTNTATGGNIWSVSSGNANNSINNSLFTIINETLSKNTFVLSPTGKLAIGENLGTINPSDALSVYDTNTILRVFDLTGNGSSVVLQATDTASYVNAAYNTTAIPLILRTANTTRLTIAATGEATFTGAIIGTTSTFTNAGSGIGVGITNSSTGDGLKITHSAGRAFQIASSATGFGILINNDTASTSVPFTIQKSGSPVITMTDAGGLTLAGALGGTSATFSGTINANSANSQIRIGGATTDAFIGVSTSTLYLTDWATAAKGLTINLSTGAATFSSSVGVGGTSAGNFSGVGFTGPFLDIAGILQIKGTSANTLAAFQLGGDTYRKALIYTPVGTDTPYLAFGVATSGSSSSANEVMRITSGGNVLIGTTAAETAALTALATGGGNCAIQGRTPNGTTAPIFQASSITTGSTSWYAYVAQSGNGSAITTNTMFVYGNGNIVNVNNSYGTLSDIKLKENIVDATPKLDDILKLKVRNFNLIGDKNKQIGFIAQEMEKIFPALIEETPDKDLDNNDLGTVTKTIKTSVLIPMLVKALQEQQKQIEELKLKIK
jgi:hypothetical protein